MTLPIVYALFEHWKDWPPTHIAVNLAFLDQKEKQQRKQAEASSNGSTEEFADSDTPKIMAIDGVQGNWQGPPAFTPDDVHRLAAAAKARNANPQ